MYKRIFSFIVVAFLFVCTSCSKKQEPKAERPLFSAADTAQVLSMVNGFMTDMQAKNYDAAIGSLKVLNGAMVKDLTDDERKDLIGYYKTFPVLTYKLVDQLWNDRDLIHYTYSVEFFEKPEGVEMPNTYKLTLVPVRIDNVWYLTLGSRQ